MEYVFQKLNGHPSNFWVNKNKKMGMKLDGLYNTKISQYKSYQDRCEDNIFSVDEEDNNPTDQNMTKSMELYRAQSEHSLLSDYLPDPEFENKEEVKKLSKEQLSDLPVDVTPYDELGAIKKLFRVLTPFELMYKKIWVNDCFIYPQLLLTCIVICFFSMSYLGYETFKAIFGFTDFLSDGYDTVYQSAFSFMRNGLDRYFSVFKYDVTSNDLEPYYKKLSKVEVTVNDFIFAVKLGAIVG